VAAATSIASALDLAVDDAVTLNSSNRLVVRLLPCDVVARVMPAAHYGSAAAEVEVARRLAERGAPVVALDPRFEPRAFVRDGFHVGMWGYAESVEGTRPSPAEYARSLGHLHAELRQVDVGAPHVRERIADVQRFVADLDFTPDLDEGGRALLAGTLRDLTRSIAERRAPEQLLHGEPHSGNVLHTEGGPLFVDFENTARGPVEYDLAWTPAEVSARCRGADPMLLDDCRGLVLAMVAAYRWRRDDRHPSGRRW